ncbi:MAG: tRNA dihydrouridine(20/20a) synthase DusA [Oceanospirillaceae bacterium]|nr:tRNA dihydrouridine(20/20a) synthase DusA [Oceanospirillaceae bacterium]
MKTVVETSSKAVKSTDTVDRTISVAPMMDWTDKHCRHFHRVISRNTLLYTEMVTTGALIYGDKDRHLAYNESEHPIALQLGGSNPQELALCAKMAEDYGYDEVNLNVGCPSDRVQNNMIGACLMGHPQIVADCLAAMRDAVSIPVTIKHRLGIDDLDSDELLHQFVETVKQSGCSTFIVHARKAILAGLSPKQNRDVPPLEYDRVYRLKRAFPQLEIIINGGIKTIAETKEHLQHIDGVMIGREAYHNPYAILAEVDQLFYGADITVITRQQVLQNMLPYIEQQLSAGVPLSYVTRHILGLFHGMRGGKQFRRVISEQAYKKDAGINVLNEAFARVEAFL